eukprot:860996-Amphidinium_carterae.2
MMTTCFFRTLETDCVREKNAGLAKGPLYVAKRGESGELSSPSPLWAGDARWPTFLLRVRNVCGRSANSSRDWHCGAMCCKQMIGCRLPEGDEAPIGTFGAYWWMCKHASLASLCALWKVTYRFTELMDNGVIFADTL